MGPDWADLGVWGGKGLPPACSGQLGFQEVLAPSAGWLPPAPNSPSNALCKGHMCWYTSVPWPGRHRARSWVSREQVRTWWWREGDSCQPPAVEELSSLQGAASWGWAGP